ncbi:hypothetical protein [Dactylosporangium sp. CA-139066]|uniref:hypothetical protein n=1 Tax=Dactylosporangium sp. CA-139066 TaxID=3239930 RepID=UPI003D92AC60
MSHVRGTLRSAPDLGTRVLYLAGWGRSGRTLAESLLDRVPGLVGVGEIKFLWERGLLRNRRCWTTGMATRHRYLTGAVTAALRHRDGYKDG